MKAVKIKSGEVFLLRFPQSILKNGKLEYFVLGQGYKQTKSFEVFESEDLYEYYDKRINELYVAQMYDKYGIEVASEYADCLVAGIIARQTAYGFGIIYQKIKDILPSNFSNDFFKLLKCDYMLSCYGMYVLDIIKLDKMFSNLDAEYDNMACKYKGNSCSMNEYVKLKFGVEYANIIKALIDY